MNSFRHCNLCQKTILLTTQECDKLNFRGKNDGIPLVRDLDREAKLSKVYNNGAFLVLFYCQT